MIMSLTIPIELSKSHVPSSKQLSTIPVKSITPGSSDSKQVVQNIFSIHLFGYDNFGESATVHQKLREFRTVWVKVEVDNMVKFRIGYDVVVSKGKKSISCFPQRKS